MSLVLHFGSSRTNEPSRNSRRQAHCCVEVMPKPATAAATVASLSFVETCGDNSRVSVLPSRSNTQALGTSVAGPPMMRCCDNSAGEVGVPASLR